LDLLVDPRPSTRFYTPAYISFRELACMPQRYPDPDRGHCWALLDSILLFLSELVDADGEWDWADPHKETSRYPWRMDDEFTQDIGTSET
jgi:hypothetical protein